MKELHIIALQNKRDKYRFLAHNSHFLEHQRKVKEKNERYKIIIVQKTLTSKSKKEIWKIIHRILNSSEKTLNADTNELNKYFNISMRGNHALLQPKLTAEMNSKT